MSAHCTQNPKTLAQLAAEPRSLIFLKVTRNTQGADPNAIVHKLSEFYLTKFALDGTIKEGPDIEEWKSILNPMYDSKAGAFVLNTAESLATAAGAYKTFVVKYVDVKDNTEHAFALQFTEKSEIKAKGYKARSASTKEVGFLTMLMDDGAPNALVAEKVTETLKAFHLYVLPDGVIHLKKKPGRVFLVKFETKIDHKSGVTEFDFRDNLRGLLNININKPHNFKLGQAYCEHWAICGDCHRMNDRDFRKCVCPTKKRKASEQAGPSAVTFSDDVDF